MNRNKVVLHLAAMALACGPVVVSAQLSGFTAPPDALDTLSGSSTGAGGAGALGIDRARAAAASANANVFGDPADGGSPFGQPAAAPSSGSFFGAGDPAAGNPGAGNPFGAGDPAANPFGAGGDPGANPFGAPGTNFAPAAYAAPATLTAWGGERIVAHGTGQILQDARVLSILATASGNYFDDGQNGNDANAGDNIYTNITINDDYISPEAQLVKTKIIQTLAYTSAQNAQQFLQVAIATTEPTSPLPQVRDLQERQDVKLTEWMTLPLAQFRVNPNDKESEFYPTYLPPPPRAPNIPLPVTFTPKKINSNATGPNGQPLPAAGGISAADGTVFGGDVTGEPIGNASSRYF